MTSAEYSKEWRKRNKDKTLVYYKKQWEERKDNSKWKEYHKIHHRKYMKDYNKKPEQIIKQKIRQQTYRIYGKVLEGFERHHVNYDSPHKFVLVTIKEHKEFHKNV